MLPTFRRVYQCTCGASVFFNNTQCLQCGRTLGYDPFRGDMVTLQLGIANGVWTHTEAPERLYQQCENLNNAAHCNWLLPLTSTADASAQGFCIACSLNRTVPSQHDSLNQTRWTKIEKAKRRLVNQLIALGLPVHSKEPGRWHNPVHGIAFDFLLSDNPKKPVLTGHDEGVITINAQEADDGYRNSMREQMGEPYRTILGHFRHEIGHYYWDVLVPNTPLHGSYRALFGDESMDYSEALKKHYEFGAPADWQTHYVSTYASCHPWEDWAETWAHYLHMRDTYDIAASYHLAPDHIEQEMAPFGLGDLYDANSPDAEDFLGFLNHWVGLSVVLNDLSRGMGQRDFYPFVLSSEVVKKLHFVHIAVNSAPPIFQ